MIQPLEQVGILSLIFPIFYHDTLGELSETTGEFTALLNEHYFLTDPEDLLLTHIPYVESDPGYSRWQLVEDPISLEEFNSRPHLSPAFFQ